MNEEEIIYEQCYLITDILPQLFIFISSFLSCLSQKGKQRKIRDVPVRKVGTDGREMIRQRKERDTEKVGLC